MIELRIVQGSERAKIDKLLAMEKNSVYNELSPYIGDMGIGQDVEKWLEAKKGELKDLICEQGRYCEFISQNRNSELANIVAGIGDVLLLKFGGTMPVNTLAVSIMKWGMAEVCEC